MQQPHFFICTVIIAGVRSTFNIPRQCQYVDWSQGEERYSDMQLMSVCKHHIIASSSLSWWGAWLNPKQDKIIITPQNLFANKTDASDLLPQGWVKF
jgi:hypothetical protein